MQVFIFGNSDLPMDALPVRLLPHLQKAFPSVEFVVLDPNEEWDVPKHMCIIDTVVGITDVTIFHDLNTFMQTPRVTCHDFDAYTNLMFMKKLGKIHSVTIIGIPPILTQNETLTKLTELLQNIVKKY